TRPGEVAIPPFPPGGLSEEPTAVAACDAGAFGSGRPAAPPGPAALSSPASPGPFPPRAARGRPASTALPGEEPVAVPRLGSPSARFASSEDGSGPDLDTGEAAEGAVAVPEPGAPKLATFSPVAPASAGPAPLPSRRAEMVDPPDGAPPAAL